MLQVWSTCLGSPIQWCSIYMFIMMLACDVHNDVHMVFIWWAYLYDHHCFVHMAIVHCSHDGHRKVIWWTYDVTFTCSCDYQGNEHMVFIMMYMWCSYIVLGRRVMRHGHNNSKLSTLCQLRSQALPLVTPSHGRGYPLSSNSSICFGLSIHWLLSLKRQIGTLVKSSVMGNKGWERIGNQLMYKN